VIPDPPVAIEIQTSQRNTASSSKHVVRRTDDKRRRVSHSGSARSCLGPPKANGAAPRADPNGGPAQAFAPSESLGCMAGGATCARGTTSKWRASNAKGDASGVAIDIVIKCIYLSL
jgi:hypothetical protein